MFECHITCSRPNNPKELEDLAKENKWKTSFIVGDPLLGKESFFYFTTHDLHLSSMIDRMEEMAKRISVPILRKKIEFIVYDTKRNLIPKVTL